MLFLLDAQLKLACSKTKKIASTSYFSVLLYNYFYLIHGIR